MARPVFVLEEVIAMLQTTSAPKRVVEAFRQHAEAVAAHRPSTVEYDDVQVASGYGSRTKRGFVELTINDQRTQMDVKKAREIGLMLLESAEAATSDEMLMTLLRDKVGMSEDGEAMQRILLDLREIRQGSRKTVYKT